jgi:hypothetical protein
MKTMGGECNLMIRYNMGLFIIFWKTPKATESAEDTEKKTTSLWELCVLCG